MTDPKKPDPAPKTAPPTPDDSLSEKERLDAELDKELEGTFLASDPPNVTRVPASKQITGDEA